MSLLSNKEAEAGAKAAHEAIHKLLAIVRDVAVTGGDAAVLTALEFVVAQILIATNLPTKDFADCVERSRQFIARARRQ